MPLKGIKNKGLKNRDFSNCPNPPLLKNLTRIKAKEGKKWFRTFK
jgi:hypothetical protein